MARMPGPFGPSRPYEMQYESAGSAAVIGRFFNAVYAWMAAGLALTAVVAWWMSNRPDLMMQLGKGGFFGLLIAEFVLVMVISAATERISAGVATVLFLVYAAMNGVYVTYFKPGRLPDRTCVGVTGLALGALVEIDLIVKP